MECLLASHYQAVWGHSIKKKRAGGDGRSGAKWVNVIPESTMRLRSHISHSLIWSCHPPSPSPPHPCYSVSTHDDHVVPLYDGVLCVLSSL